VTDLAKSTLYSTTPFTDSVDFGLVCRHMGLTRREEDKLAEAGAYTLGLQVFAQRDGGRALCCGIWGGFSRLWWEVWVRVLGLGDFGSEEKIMMALVTELRLGKVGFCGRTWANVGGYASMP